MGKHTKAIGAFFACLIILGTANCLVMQPAHAFIASGEVGILLAVIVWEVGHE